MKTVKFKSGNGFGTRPGDDVYIVAARIVGFAESTASGSRTCIITDDKDSPCNSWLVNDTPEEVAALLEEALPDAPATAMLGTSAMMDNPWNYTFTKGDDMAESERHYDTPPGERNYATAGISVTSAAHLDAHVNAIEIYQSPWGGVTSMERSQKLMDFVLDKLNEENQK